MNPRISVPGSWGEWSGWSACNVECGRGVRERQRACDSPAPVNGGPGCDGPAIEKKSCSQVGRGEKTMPKGPWGWVFFLQFDSQICILKRTRNSKACPYIIMIFEQ